MHQFKAAILLYLSSIERKRFVKLKKTIVLLSYQVNEHQGLAGDEKLRDVSVSYCFALSYGELHTDVIENFQ